MGSLALAPLLLVLLLVGCAESSVRIPAPAGEPCGGYPGVACEEGHYCAMEAGQCNIADNVGMCRKTPEICTEHQAAVCACDGTTYGNACKAAMAEAKVDKPGACP